MAAKKIPVEMKLTEAEARELRYMVRWMGEGSLNRTRVAVTRVVDDAVTVALGEKDQP